jgi:hypothetical protein
MDPSEQPETNGCRNSDAVSIGSVDHLQSPNRNCISCARTVAFTPALKDRALKRIVSAKGNG